jgi:hypothetical protein
MKPEKVSICGVCATPHFERNNYFYGKQFTVRDLLQEQSYFNEKRHLVNRMVLGWGVVCGLDVRWDPKKRELVVGTGMALDCCGHEIVVCEEQRVAFEDYEEQCRRAQEKPDLEGKFVLCLEYDECNAEPVDLPAVGCDDDERSEFNRIRDGFKLRIKNWKDACPKQTYEDIDCPNHYKHDVNVADSEPANCETEKIHHYLCSKLKECPGCEGCDCVILATIYFEKRPGDQQPSSGYAQDQYRKPDEYQKYPQTTGQDEQTKYNQGDQYTGAQGKDLIEPRLDTCTDRRLVYNNSLLYDLIHCHHGDLPHIVDFSWRTHTYPNREVSIDAFLQMMKDGLTVYFDQELVKESLNPHTFIVSYLHRDTGTGAFVENRIPVKDIICEKIGTCYTATFQATERWINKELDADDSELRAGLPNLDSGVNVEITLRGSRIWSTEGKGLDGDYLADKLPTGNGTQGGDFVDWFRVVTPEVKKPNGKAYDGF